MARAAGAHRACEQSQGGFLRGGGRLCRCGWDGLDARARRLLARAYLLRQGRRGGRPGEGAPSGTAEPGCAVASGTVSVVARPRPSRLGVRGRLCAQQAGGVPGGADLRLWHARKELWRWWGHDRAGRPLVRPGPPADACAPRREPADRGAGSGGPARRGAPELARKARSWVRARRRGAVHAGPRPSLHDRHRGHHRAGRRHPRGLPEGTPTTGQPAEGARRPGERS